MSKIAILGVGNRFRGDDGAGWSVIDALERKLLPRVKLCKVRGDLAEVLDLFASHSIVYVVDACLAEAPKGSWERIDLSCQPLNAPNKPTSTHGFTIKEAVELASTLGGLPSKLILYVIRGENFTLCEELSPPVETGVAQVVRELLKEKEIQACTKEV